MDETTPSRGLSRLPDHARAPTLHAGFWRRVAAYIIDWFILVPVVLVMEFVWLLQPMIAHAHDPDVPLPIGRILLFYLLAILIPWLYYAICESSKWQATVGKLAMGLRVTDDYGRRIGFGRATGRFFGKIISGMIMDVGYMMAGFTERKQGLHDMMAKTLVLNGRASEFHDAPVQPSTGGGSFNA